MQAHKTRHQDLSRFDPQGVHGDTRHRTHLHTLGFVKVSDTFGAAIGIDLIDLRPEKDRFIGAFGLADIAIDAGVRDHQGHDAHYPGKLRSPLRIMDADRELQA